MTFLDHQEEDQTLRGRHFLAANPWFARLVFGLRLDGLWEFAPPARIIAAMTPENFEEEELYRMVSPDLRCRAHHLIGGGDDFGI